MEAIINKILPVLTFILGFAINWFVNRKEFYWRFYREKELQLLSEMNAHLRDIFINCRFPSGDGVGIFYSEIGNDEYDKKEIRNLGRYPILLSAGLSKHFILKKYVDDPFIPENIREIIKGLTDHKKKVDDNNSGTKHLKVFDLNEIDHNDEFGKIDFYIYGDSFQESYTYAHYYNRIKELKLSINKILKRK